MKRILILLALMFYLTGMSEAACLNIPVAQVYGTSLTGTTFNPGDSVVLFTLPASGYSFARVNCVNSTYVSWLSDFKIFFPNICTGCFCPLYFDFGNSFMPVTGPGDITIQNTVSTSHTFTSDINAVCVVEVF